MYEISNILDGGSVQLPSAAPRPTKKIEAFSDVTLKHQIPSTFLVNEIFQIEGEVNQTKLSAYLRTQPYGTKHYYLTLAFINTKSGEQLAFTQTLRATQTSF